MKKNESTYSAIRYLFSIENRINMRSRSKIVLNPVEKKILIYLDAEEPYSSIDQIADELELSRGEVYKVLLRLEGKGVGS